MPQSIIDHLETVKVNEVDSDLFMGGISQRKKIFDAKVKVGPVGQFCQTVMVCQKFSPFLGGNNLLQIGIDRNEVFYLAFFIPDNGKGKPNFQKFKEFSVGKMPFDAMIQGNTYIVGFFLTKGFGVIDLNQMKYRLIKVTGDGNKPVLKIPHFGFWSLSRDKTFIPAVGNNAVMVYDKKFNFIKNIEVQGLPVFTSLSPNQKYIAVTFSGKDFPYIQIIDTGTLKVIKTFKFKGKVLHVRWSQEYPDLYVSVNGANEVDVINTKDWFVEREIYQVKKPSGIFLYQY